MSEHSEQVALFEWATWQVNLGHEPLKWMFAIPNGGHRRKVVAAKLKAEGVKPGVSDIMLPFPAKGHHGLFIEMKYGRNKATDFQLEYLAWFNKVGYLAVVANGFDEAKNIIVDYLDIKGVT